MSMERHDLHDELVALIAAGRELPPEHDTALADIFLNHARYQSAAPATPPNLFTSMQDWRVVAGALLLALSAFFFGAGFGHAAGPDGRYGDGFGHRGYWNDDGRDGTGGSFRYDWPPFHQIPSVPSSPSDPSNPGV